MRNPHLPSIVHGNPGTGVSGYVKDEILGAPCRYVDAVYHEPKWEIPEYADNILVLALPAFTSRRRILRTIDSHYLKAAPPNSRQWSLEKKIAGIGLIRSTLASTSHALPLIDIVYGGLRSRYLNCDPRKNRQQVAQLAYELTQVGSPKVIREDSEAHSECYAIFGVSGMGKSTLIKTIVSTLPPAIQHANPCFRQIVYIYVECPYNGSIKMLMEAILMQIDFHTGSHYLSNLKARSTEQEYIYQAVTALKNHATGLLIIDDIEFVLRTTATQLTIDFIAALLNANCCMVIVVATPDIKPLIRSKMRLGRRYLSGGAIDIDPCDVDDPDSIKVLDGITRLDFLPAAPNDIAGVRSALARFSAGVTGIAKESWRLTQYGALSTGEHCITPEMVDAYSRPTFSTIDGLLGALQNRDWAFLSTVTDALSRAVDLEIQKRDRKEFTDKFYSVYKAREAQNAFLDAVEALTKIGFPQIKAEEVIQRILVTEPDLEAAALVQRALEERFDGAVNAQKKHPKMERGKRTESKRSKQRANRHAVSIDFDPEQFLDPSSAR
jgi:hypothetical protein